MSHNPYKPSALPAWEGPLAPLPETPVVTGMFSACQFAVGLAAGFGIWVATAPREAWDANPVYFLCVLAAGTLASLFRLHGSWWSVLGIYVGQVIGLSVLVPNSGGAIFPAWFGVLVCGTLQAVIGAALGGAIGYGLRWLHRKLAQHQ